MKGGDVSGVSGAGGQVQSAERKMKDDVMCWRCWRYYAGFDTCDGVEYHKARQISFQKPLKVPIRGRCVPPREVLEKALKKFRMKSLKKSLKTSLKT